MKFGQGSPETNANIHVWEEVIKDMKSRDNFGKSKYNTHLQPFNGRNPLQDAYEEALDLAVYLKQALIENEKKESTEDA